VGMVKIRRLTRRGVFRGGRENSTIGGKGGRRHMPLGKKRGEKKVAQPLSQGKFLLEGEKEVLVKRKGGVDDFNKKKKGH